MILRIPDEYVTLLDYLSRNGIPFEKVENKYKDALSARAETLNYINIIDLNQVNKEDLIEKAICYIDEKTGMNQYVLENLYNESLRHAYADLTGQDYQEVHVEK